MQNNSIRKGICQVCKQCKLHYQINHQWKSLLEVRQIQIKMLNEIMLRNYQTRKEDGLPRVIPVNGAVKPEKLNLSGGLTGSAYCRPAGFPEN